MRKLLIIVFFALFPAIVGAQTPLGAYSSPATGSGVAGAGAFGPNFSVGTGTAQAQTVAPTTAITNVTLVNGYQICWTPNAANTGAAPTLAGTGSSTFSAKPITKYGTVALIANDLSITVIACAEYDGTEFQLLNPAAGAIFTTSVQGGVPGGAGGSFNFPEGTLPASNCSAGNDFMYGDSTLHGMEFCFNNGAFVIQINGNGVSVVGTTAGFAAFTQGSTSGSNPLCNPANTACWQAPTAVTSYVADVPGASPVNNNSGFSCTNASPAICSFTKMPVTAITSGTAYTNASTNFSSVVGGSGQTLQFSVEANTNYLATCQILWSASVATAGPKFQFTGPASPTAVQYAVMQAVTATTDGTAGATAFATSLNASGATVVATTNEPAMLTIGLVNGANAGTVVLQAAAQGVGTLTIQPGSFCQAQ